MNVNGQDPELVILRGHHEIPQALGETAIGSARTRTDFVVIVTGMTIDVNETGIQIIERATQTTHVDGEMMGSVMNAWRRGGETGMQTSIVIGTGSETESLSGILLETVVGRLARNVTDALRERLGVNGRPILLMKRAKYAKTVRIETVIARRRKNQHGWIHISLSLPVQVYLVLKVQWVNLTVYKLGRRE